MKKKLLLLFFSLSLIWGVERFCHSKTDGFAIVNITSPLPSCAKWDVTNPPGWEEILSQEFTYLNCGAQNYVFESRDGKYVLKFFKHQHMRIPPVLQHLPLPEKLHKMREAKIAKKKSVQEAIFQSMKIAFENLREETALVALHLNKSSNLPHSLTIIDKIGVRHTIDPNQVEFVLQKKASLAYDKIKEWVEMGETAKAESLLKEALLLSQKRISRGIFDKDPDFATNFGVVGERLVQIDMGRFSYQSNKDSNELYRITRPLHRHIAHNHPELLEKFDLDYEELQK